MDWDDLRVVLAVARHGSHKRAARALMINATTVSRRLGALEIILGVKLFDRTPDRLIPTTAGRSLIAPAERIEMEVAASQRELQAGDARVQGEVRVSASDGTIHYLLVPAVRELLATHPGLSLQLRTEAHLADLSRREADVAVRLVRPTAPALVARRLGNMPFGLFASVGYLERRGTPRRLPDLRAHDWVGFDATFDQVPHIKWLHKYVPKINYALRVNSTSSQRLACAEGLGLALLPCFAGEGDTRLRRLLPRITTPVREVYAVTHVDVRGNARVDAVIQWLLRVFDGVQR